MKIVKHLIFNIFEIFKKEKKNIFFYIWIYLFILLYIKYKLYKLLIIIIIYIYIKIIIAFFTRKIVLNSKKIRHVMIYKYLDNLQKIKNQKNNIINIIIIIIINTISGFSLNMFYMWLFLFTLLKKNFFKWKIQYNKKIFKWILLSFKNIRRNYLINEYKKKIFSIEIIIK